MDRKLRVLMLAPTTVVGGITTWLRFLLKYSDQSHVEYYVIDTSKNYQPLGMKLNLIGAVLGMRDALFRFFKIINTVFIKRTHLVYFTCAPSIGLVVRDSFYMFLLFLLRVPTVAHLHGGNVDGFFGGNTIRRTIVRHALACCRVIIVITREIQAAGEDIFGKDKIVYMPNMYDDELFDFENDKKIYSDEGNVLNLVHVAWQSPEKGSLDLVESMAVVKSNISCDLVGTAAPDNKIAIEEKIKSLNVGTRIRMLGQKTGQDIADVFQRADIFILPTHKEGPEGFPMVILEAMAYGIPIIANNVGNIAEMIGVDTDCPAGLLLTHIDPISIEELAGIIDKLSENVVLRKTLSSNGKKRIQNNYLASKVVPQLEFVLLNLSI